MAALIRWVGMTDEQVARLLGAWKQDIDEEVARQVEGARLAIIDIDERAVAAAFERCWRDLPARVRYNVGTPAIAGPPQESTAMAKVFVKNNTAQLIGLGLQHNSAHKGVAKLGTQLTLKPGVNEVESDDWDVALKNLTIKKMLEDEARDGGRSTLEVVAHMEKSTKELPEDEVVKLISETFAAEQLKQFSKDKRAAVRTAYEKQEKVIAKTEAEKEKEAKARAEKEEASKRR
jgi:hypothetical protein